MNKEIRGRTLTILSLQNCGNWSGPLDSCIEQYMTIFEVKTPIGLLCRERRGLLPLQFYIVALFVLGTAVC